MADDTLYVLDDHDAAELREMHRRVKGLVRVKQGRAPNPAYDAAGAQHHSWVEITSTVQTANRYPGLWGQDDETAAPPVITAQVAACWVRAASGGLTLATGVWYWARQEGPAADGAPVYVVDDSVLNGLGIDLYDGTPQYAAGSGITDLAGDVNGVLTFENAPLAGDARFIVAAASETQFGIINIAEQHLQGLKTFSLVASACLAIDGTASSFFGAVALREPQAIGNPPPDDNNLVLRTNVFSEGGFAHSMLHLATRSPSSSKPYGLFVPGKVRTGNLFSVLVSGINPALNTNTWADGVTGTSGGGDTITGGIVTALGAGGTITIGTTAIAGGVVGDIIKVDGAGKVGQATLASLLTAAGGITANF